MAGQDSTEHLGSASWSEANRYEPGGEFHERAATFLLTVNWDVLSSISSRLRNGIPCKVNGAYSIGHFNMVRHIVFADGVNWVARVRLPGLSLFGNREALDVASILKVEIASMNFFRAKTTILVPKVHSYDLDPRNEVGAPYILMDYIHRTTATELEQAKNCDVDLFGTPSQDRKFRKQMADIQVQISSFTFDQIGSLYQDEETSEFFIGPDIETGKGPWTSSMDYYTDLANHVLQECVRSAKPEVQGSVSFAVPSVFQHLICLYGQDRSTETRFSLVNRDFGAHNLLVDDNFEIIGLIDLDGVMAAPAEVVAQYPVLTGLDRPIPGHIETRPAALERIKRTEPQLKEYQRLIENAEAAMNSSDERRTSIAKLMLSDAASIVQGLLRYRGHQKFVNDNWMEAYVRLLHSYYTRALQDTDE